jgi:beta-glucosidase
LKFKDLNNDGKLNPTYKETTLSGMDHLKEVANSFHSRGGKVIMSVNIIMPWILGNVEPLADALIAGYDTFYQAQFEVMAGNFSPLLVCYH